jgi:hypothetical protein
VTTTIRISSPAPNHEDLLVQREVVTADGRVVPEGQAVRVREGGHLTEHLYSGRRLVITEIPRGT